MVAQVSPASACDVVCMDANGVAAASSTRHAKTVMSSRRAGFSGATARVVILTTCRFWILVSGFLCCILFRNSLSLEHTLT